MLVPDFKGILAFYIIPEALGMITECLGNHVEGVGVADLRLPEPPIRLR
ncbi:MAG: hypothetical protein AVDCRST_MAG28-1026 [uncultured Rubrobacteraceae bacterium]|uniref:Uncharacterized protein n=1 Tax=uncultured Rubrobacteraceae bacterium TaxID=349277 RepID=A0A6J4QNS8_9ACTN|nr:MAG: hypothetical protein AVDCRST_MAG28-1026 [uncultured Rubrobacteraceae bacterium]